MDFHHQTREESMMKNMGGPAASGIDSSQMKEQMKRIGEMSPDELKTPLGYVAWFFLLTSKRLGVGKMFSQIGTHIFFQRWVKSTN